MKITWTDIAIALNKLSDSIEKAKHTLSAGEAGVAYTAASMLARRIGVIGAGGLAVGTIDAIKAYRNRTGQGLYDSKCAIDKVRFGGEAVAP